MRRTIVSAGVLVAVMLAHGTPVRAQSDMSGRDASIFTDVKAKKIGDVISVIIAESNSATKNAQTNTNKTNATTVDGTATTGALSGLFPGMSGSVDANNQYKGTATTSRNGSLNSRMTVRVIDILPDRSLVIEGSKTMEINEDLEVVTLSGIIQPQYISSSNTVYSYEIADARFTYKGKGAVSQGQRMGLISRIINWIL